MKGSGRTEPPVSQPALAVARGPGSAAVSSYVTVSTLRFSFSGAVRAAGHPPSAPRLNSTSDDLIVACSSPFLSCSALAGGRETGAHREER